MNVGLINFRYQLEVIVRLRDAQDCARTALCPGANSIDTVRSETGTTQSLRQGTQSWALSQMSNMHLDVRLTQTSLQCTWEELTTQQAHLPLDQGTQLSDWPIHWQCNLSRRMSPTWSTVSLVIHRCRCSQYTPVVVRWRRGKVRIGHRIPNISCAAEDRTISFMIFIVSDKQRWNFIIFPVADGTAKLSGRDHEFREPTLRHE